MRRIASACVLLVLASAASAQYASTLLSISESPALTVREALWLAGSASGSLEVGTSMDAAPAALVRLGVIDERTADAGGLDGLITIADYSRLLMRLEELPGGFWHGRRAGAFVSFYYLRRIGVVDESAWPSDPLSGARAVDVTRRYLGVLRAREADR